MVCETVLLTCCVNVNTTDATAGATTLVCINMKLRSVNPCVSCKETASMCVDASTHVLESRPHVRGVPRPALGSCGCTPRAAPRIHEPSTHPPPQIEHLVHPAEPLVHLPPMFTWQRFAGCHRGSKGQRVGEWKATATPLVGPTPNAPSTGWSAQRMARRCATMQCLHPRCDLCRPRAAPVSGCALSRPGSVHMPRPRGTLAAPVLRPLCASRGAGCVVLVQQEETAQEAAAVGMQGDTDEGLDPSAAPGQIRGQDMTEASLAAATPEQREQLLGDRLFPLISQVQPTFAAKITGMLLEMDNGKLLCLLESPEALNAMITKAVSALETNERGMAVDSTTAAASKNDEDEDDSDEDEDEDDDEDEDEDDDDDDKEEEDAVQVSPQPRAACRPCPHVVPSLCPVLRPLFPSR